MYLSKLFIPITKDLPSEAKIKSHQLMLRTGMIKQSSTGIYSWLPLGYKIMKKVELAREEQKLIEDKIINAYNSISRYLERERTISRLQEEMLRIKDRQGREMLYGPTNEELITDILDQHRHTNLFLNTLSYSMEI